MKVLTIGQCAKICKVAPEILAKIERRIAYLSQTQDTGWSNCTVIEELRQVLQEVSGLIGAESNMAKNKAAAEQDCRLPSPRTDKGSIADQTHGVGQGNAGDNGARTKDHDYTKRP